MLQLRNPPPAAKYAVAHLRKLDWVQRHRYFEKIAKHNPSMGHAIQSAMHPGELLSGFNTGMPALPTDIIVLKDKNRKRPYAVQTTLHMWFFVKKRRISQQTLDKYFAQ